MMASILFRALDFTLQRPTLVFGIVAAILGALLGTWIAARRGISLAPIVEDGPSAVVSAVRGKRRDRGVGAAFGLVPIVLRLLSNPVAQAFLRRAIAKQISRRFSR